MADSRIRASVTGLVQGVGYRPFVVSRARQLGLQGRVRNAGGRVEIEAAGDATALDALVRALVEDAPAAAEVREVLVTETGGPSADPLPSPFAVAPSIEAPGGAAVAPDRAPCADCLAELDRPGSRRRGYVFSSCNACGPRASVIEAAPYARELSTMRGFDLCEACRSEMATPGSRLHLAETIACPACGPRLRIVGDAIDGGAEPLAAAAAALVGGAIGAVRGVGGYHLVCDATSAAAVERLRTRKRREARPFAILVLDLDAADAIAELTNAERDLLAGWERPIVLVRRRARAASGPAIAEAVAPGSPSLGLLLPPSLLHLALVRAAGRPLVLTSGNRSDEPMAIDEAGAESRLGAIADFFLHHDRAIAERLDDSVVRIAAGRPLMLRRGRGFAPALIELARPAIEPILAIGGDLKSAFAIASGSRATLGAHVGDLGDVEATLDLTRSLDRAQRLLGVTPTLVAHDRHPDAESTRIAIARAAVRGGRTLAVTHHHAHVASCLADRGHEGPALGVAFDGLGLGELGDLRGGEVLMGDARAVERVAHLRAVPMIGGDLAARSPWRMALAHLLDAGLPTARLERWARPGELALATAAAASAALAPPTTSIGRLFDAVACLVGLRGGSSFEGQAAVELEWAAAASADDGRYDFALHPGAPIAIDARPMIRAVVADVDRGQDRGAIAARFHRGLAAAIAATCATVRAQRGGAAPAVIALSGGVFVNAVLLEAVIEAASTAGFTVLHHLRVPPGDGGLCLGQLAVAIASAVPA